MLQRLVPGARISGLTAEAAREYVREQLRITRPEEVEPMRRWADIISYYRGVQTEPELIREWLLPATRIANGLMATWANRCKRLSAPESAASLHEARGEYYLSGERWLSAMVDSLQNTMTGNPSAKRRHHDVTLLATKHHKARVRAEKEMQRLVKRLA